jgi:lipopolysaccharide transport system permease protein
LLRSMKRVSWVKRWLPISEQWWAKFDLLIALVRRDLQARYKGSVLGSFWPLLNQLSQLLIFTYVFSTVLKVKPDNLPPNIPFSLWLFAGLLPWNAFTSGLIQAAGSVVAQPNLVKKVVFPLALLPLVSIFSIFIESSFGLMALIVLVAVFAKTVHTTLLLLPLVWLPQLLLTAGLGYFAAGLTIFLRDTQQGLGIILNIWLYFAPIVYPASLIPQEWRNWVFWLNPLATIAEMYRDLVLAGKVDHWGELGVATVVSVVVFSTGLSVYQKLRPAFADVL